jgi:hypothetical protein
MIIDGWSTKVELYNYETGQQCFLPDMPNPNYNGNAAWLNDTAIACVGGAAYQSNCTIFDQASNTWIKVKLKNIYDICNTQYSSGCLMGSLWDRDNLVTKI